MKMQWRAKFIAIIASLALAVSMMPAIAGIAYADDDTRIAVTAVEFTMQDYTPQYGDEIDRYAFAWEFGTDTFATVGSPVYFCSGMGSWYKKVDGVWKKTGEIGEENFKDGIYQYQVQIRTDSNAYNTDADGNNGMTHFIGNPCTVKVNGVDWGTLIDPYVGDDFSYSYTSSPEYTVEKPEDVELSVKEETSLSEKRLYVSQAIAEKDLTSLVLGGSGTYTFTKVDGPDWIQVSTGGKLSGTPTEKADATTCRIEVSDGTETREIQVNIPEVCPDPALRETISAVEFQMKDYTPKYGDEIQRYAFAEEFGTDTFATLGSPAYFCNGMGFWVKKVDDDWVRTDNLGETTFQDGVYQYQVQIRTDGDAYHTDADGNNGTTHIIADVCTVKVNGVEWEPLSDPSVGDDFSYSWTSSPEYEIHDNSHEHSYTTETTQATTTTDGVIKEVCKECGDIKSETVIPKVSSISLSTTTYTYNGKAKSPTLTIKDSSGKTLKNGTDYTVSTPSGRKNVGTYTYNITFKGNYAGTESKSFKINPVKTSVTKVTKAKKAFTVKWSKKSTQVTGYRIQYSTSSKFTNPKYVTVSSYKTTSKKISKLSAKKKYYVRVQTYKTVSGTKYYSSWSSYKSVKTK